MKNLASIFILLITIILLSECRVQQPQQLQSTVIQGTFTAVNIPKPEIVVQPELREFLKKNPKPRVVLRVPSTTSNVTATESEKNNEYNNLYGRIERELMKAGYTVRDRSLLNNLLTSGQNLSFKEIGEKVQTDIIIEIISISHKRIDDISNKQVDIEHIKLNAEGEYENFLGYLYDPGTIPITKERLKLRLYTENYIIDCKIVLVNTGATVAMLTFNYCRGDKNRNDTCPFELDLLTNGNINYWRNFNIRKPGDSIWRGDLVSRHSLKVG